MTSARILHQGPQTCHEVPDVGYMRKHVVRDDEIGTPMELGDIGSCRYAEELHDRRDAQRLRRLGHVLGRLDTQDRYVPRHEVLE